MCHVNKYIRCSKSVPDPPRAPDRIDRPPGNRLNCWFRLDADGAGDRSSGFETNGWTLETVHLPVPSLGGPFHLM